jgi:hypothetical protein
VVSNFVVSNIFSVSVCGLNKYKHKCGIVTFMGAIDLAKEEY